MNIVRPLCLVPLLIVAASCGGDEPRPKAGDNAPPSRESQSSQDANASGQATGAGAEQQPAPSAQEPTKRKRSRPKVDTMMIKAMLGNEPPAPPAATGSTAELVALGKALFHADGLFEQGKSCASCHDLANYGAVAEATSPGPHGRVAPRNAPSVYNASRQLYQFWDARVSAIEAAVTADDEVVSRVQAVDGLDGLFAAAFPDASPAVTTDNIATALGAFQRTLKTESKWDAYLGGNQRALDNDELTGLKAFMDVGCTTCHMGRTLGGMMVQKLGVHEPWTGDDTGKMLSSGSDNDKYIFKVPGLLNIAETAPYYHDGSMATLEEAVRDMAKRQLGKELDDEQTETIVAFLKSLTGELPAEFAAGK